MCACVGEGLVNKNCGNGAYAVSHYTEAGVNFLLMDGAGGGGGGGGGLSSTQLFRRRHG